MLFKKNTQNKCNARIHTHTHTHIRTNLSTRISDLIWLWYAMLRVYARRWPSSRFFRVNYFFWGALWSIFRANWIGECDLEQQNPRNATTQEALTALPLEINDFCSLLLLFLLLLLLLRVENREKSDDLQTDLQWMIKRFI